jgi:predicted XRE-type DNA-binding protein
MGGLCNSSVSGVTSSDVPHALRTDLRLILSRVIAETGLSQTRTAKLCSTDQPTLSKILSGRSDSVSTDQLIRWLVQLGCNIEIKIQRPHGLTAGMIKAAFDE